MDEAFADLTGIPGDLTDFGRNLRETIFKHTGIPVGVGIARTKTLAKLANDTAKRLLDQTGGMMDLWSKYSVEPAVAHHGTAGEVAFSVADRAVVESTYQAWTADGLMIAQAPVDMDFGYTFVALDPDAHRLRVFAVPR